MKNKLSKLLLVLSMAMAVVGLTLTDSEFAFADGEKVVKIHYLRDDNAYSDYKIAIWEDANQGTDYDFTVEGNEGVATYTCSNSEASVVSFFIKKNDGTSDVNKNRVIDVEELSGTVDIYVKAGVEEFSTEPFASSGSNNANTTADVSTTPEGETTAKAARQDDPNKDYSLGTALTVVADVVVIAILAGVSYLVCSEKKKTN